MRILFVHGMGRTPLSGAPLLWRLRRAGHGVETFSYFAFFQDFDTIRDRLCARVAILAARGGYALVGHSLGGVLLRSALERLPPGTRPPSHLFLLGSPVVSARLARRLQGRLLYRILAGDCGQLLASEARMAAIGPAPAATAIAGTKGLGRGPFRGEANDGVVALAETRASWILEERTIPVIHTLLPASGLAASIILERLGPSPSHVQDPSC